MSFSINLIYTKPLLDFFPPSVKWNKYKTLHWQTAKSKLSTVINKFHLNTWISYNHNVSKWLNHHRCSDLVGFFWMEIKVAYFKSHYIGGIYRNNSLDLNPLWSVINFQRCFWHCFLGSLQCQQLPHLCHFIYRSK